MDLIEKKTELELEQLLTVFDLARRLKISTRQVWRLVKQGQVPSPLKLARSARWRESEISAFIANGCKMVPPP